MLGTSGPAARRTCWSGDGTLCNMADKTSSSTTIDVRRQAVMAVIADFAAYPQWASGVRAAEVVLRGPDGRPAQVRFTLDAGIIKDKYVLGYTWRDDDEVRWDLVE